MNKLILATSDQNILASCQGLNDYFSISLIMNSFGTLLNDVLTIRPDVLLLDFDLLWPYGAIRKINLTQLSAETKVIILGGEISEELEWSLLKGGVRGCCPSDLAPGDMREVVLAVQQGELWIRRKLTSRLVDELGKTTSKNKAYRARFGLLNQLTQREFDIALRVSKGESNKQIAQECYITERTVKAHLTEIFQKLGVTDRLNLALFMSIDSRSGAASLESSLP